MERREPQVGIEPTTARHNPRPETAVTADGAQGNGTDRGAQARPRTPQSAPETVPIPSRLGLTERDVARFWSKVDRSGECWLWTAGQQSAGYGLFSAGGRMLRAHRIAYALAYGAEPPAALQVCHRCDVRTCVRPDHLFLGTNADNVADMVAKRRQAHGQRNGRAKLTAAEVRDLRARVRAGESIASVARRLGMHYKTVWRAAAGRSYQHLEVAA